MDEVGKAILPSKTHLNSAIIPISDHVIISCITMDGSCEYSKKQMYDHCENGGWILGHLINGTQAEYVRIPHADNSL